MMCDPAPSTQIICQPLRTSVIAAFPSALALIKASLAGETAVSPASDALISASADGKAAITDVRNGWHMIWVEGAGSHIIRVHTRAQIDRSSGQPRLTLSPQLAPRAKLKLNIAGEREVLTEPARAL